MAHWTLVAHGTGARIFRTRDGALARVKDVDHPEGHHPDRAYTDRPGRADTGLGRTAYEPHTTGREHDTAVFARELAGALGELTRDDPAPDLVVVAPHKLLGALKEALPGPLARQVSRWDARDLAHLDDAGVRAALG